MCLPRPWGVRVDALSGGRGIADRAVLQAVQAPCQCSLPTATLRFGLEATLPAHAYISKTPLGKLERSKLQLFHVQRSWNSSCDKYAIYGHISKPLCEKRLGSLEMSLRCDYVVKEPYGIS